MNTLLPYIPTVAAALFGLIGIEAAVRWLGRRTGWPPALVWLLCVFFVIVAVVWSGCDASKNQQMLKQRLEKNQLLAEENIVLGEGNSILAEENRALAEQILVLGKKNNVLAEENRARAEQILVLGKKNNVLGEENRARAERILVLGRKNNVLGEENRARAERILVLGRKNNVLAEENRALAEKILKMAKHTPLAPFLEIPELKIIIPRDEACGSEGRIVNELEMPRGIRSLLADNELPVTIDALGADSTRARLVFTLPMIRTVVSCNDGTWTIEGTDLDLQNADASTMTVADTLQDSSIELDLRQLDSGQIVKFSIRDRLHNRTYFLCPPTANGTDRLNEDCE